MKIGDLIWDASLGLHGVVIEIWQKTQYCTILYSDGIATPGVRRFEVEVVNESR